MRHGRRGFGSLGQACLLSLGVGVSSAAAHRGNGLIRARHVEAIVDVRAEVFHPLVRLGTRARHSS